MARPYRTFYEYSSRNVFEFLTAPGPTNAEAAYCSAPPAPEIILPRFQQKLTAFLLWLQARLTDAPLHVKSPDEELLSDTVRRLLVALYLQGVLAILVIAPLGGQRFFVLGCIQLLAAFSGNRLALCVGPRTATRVLLLGSYVVTVPIMVVTGGVQSPFAQALLITVVASAIVLKVRQTILWLVCTLSLLGILAFVQSRGVSLPLLFVPVPMSRWVVITANAINISISVITIIQAHRTALRAAVSSATRLAAAEAAASGALLRQRELYRDISHELRSPLSRLSLCLTNVRREAGPVPSASLARAESESERLNELVSNLLLLAQLQHGMEFPLNEPVDLDEELTTICEDATFEGSVAGQSVVLRSAGPCPVIGCAALLRSACDNVIRNALRHAPEDSELEVTLATDLPEEVTITVADRGPGVPEPLLQKIFEPFYRAIAEGDGGPGTGLGLAITREAIGRHGGRVFAANRPSGGLVVTMVIPRKAWTSPGLYVSLQNNDTGTEQNWI